eukprot:g5031.t1
MITDTPSASERAYTCLGIEADIRADGRGRLDYRSVELERGTLEQSNGSARVTLGGALGTDVFASIKAAVGEPAHDRPEQGRIEFSVECSPSVSPQFERRMASNVNAELTQVLSCTLAQCGLIEDNRERLCIIPGAACWVLSVDITVTAYGGNLTDAVVLAAYAALRDARVPRLELFDSEDGGQDYELDPDEGAAWALRVGSVPLCVTLAKIGASERLFVVDAAASEDVCAESRVSVAVRRDGAVCGCVKLGRGSIEVRAMRSMLQTAVHLARQLFAAVDGVLGLGDEDGPGMRSDTMHSDTGVRRKNENER